jgi:hypothetical protein
MRTPNASIIHERTSHMIDPTMLPHLLSALAHQAEADAAPYRERALSNVDIQELVAEFTDWRMPPDATAEGEALRACYRLVFQVMATSPGQWHHSLPHAHI